VEIWTIPLLVLSFSAIQRPIPLLLLLLLLLSNKLLRILLPYFLSLVNKIFSNFFLSFCCDFRFYEEGFLKDESITEREVFFLFPFVGRALVYAVFCGEELLLRV
jgi:hypothetical protein